MEKIFKNKEIFEKVGDKPIPAKEYKHLLEDDDIVKSGWEEPYYSENNSCDGYYYVIVIRKVLETDEEFEQRKIEVKESLDSFKEKRYQRYLELKKKNLNNNSDTHGIRE